MRVCDSFKIRRLHRRPKLYQSRTPKFVVPYLQIVTVQPYPSTVSLETGRIMRRHPQETHEVPRLAIVTFLVLGAMAFVPGLNHLAVSLLQIVFLYFKTGMRG